MRRGNIHTSTDKRDFFVFVNPENWSVQHNIKLTGCFTSTPQFKPIKSPLIFFPNPEFEGAISPFQNGMLLNYIADYNLEIHRADRYAQYPSRLNALFLLGSREDAENYRQAHPEHTRGRILKKCVTNSSYLYSTHDAAWVDFMRIGHSMDDETIRLVTSSYWSGERAQEGMAESMGKPWIPKSVQEVLFLGRVDFTDRDLTKCELGSNLEI